MKIQMSFNEALDQLNKERYGSVNTKSVKLKESTYEVLLDMKKSNNFKSIDDVIVKCVTLVALNGVNK